MKKESINSNIIRYLEGRDFTFEGSVARAVHDVLGTKEDCISRRLREMYNAGLLEKTYEQIDGKGPRCVLYRLSEYIAPREAYNAPQGTQMTLV